MKVGISVIILSNALDDEIYQMNSNCISSLFISENWDAIGNIEVFLIESNKKSNYVYDANVLVVVPQQDFNFNKFLNIGIKNSNNQYVALCNNDIIFQDGWFREILKVKCKQPKIVCFSPIDRNYNTMSLDKFPNSQDFYIGWENKSHFSAWCFVLDKKIFSVIGELDEVFNFYSADDDFLMTLRKYALDNALVTKSQVKHLSQQVTKKIDKKNPPQILDTDKYPISENDLKMGFAWLWDDIRFYEAFYKMKKKWGESRMIGRINRLLDRFPFLRKRIVTQILYSKSANIILSKITKI